MRKMTEAERQFSYALPGYQCCFCGHRGLAPGPRGDASMNMKCPGCGAVLNLIASEYGLRYGDGVRMFGDVVQEPTLPYVPISLDTGLPPFPPILSGALATLRRMAAKAGNNQVEAEAALAYVEAALQDAANALKTETERCASIAFAIDSGRGNEKVIAVAIIRGTGRESGESQGGVS